MPPQESPRSKHRGEGDEHRRSRRRDASNRASRAKDSASSGTQALSVDALASLNRMNDRADTEPDTPIKTKARGHRRQETQEEDLLLESQPPRRSRRRDTEERPVQETPPTRHHRRRRTEENVLEKPSPRKYRRRDSIDGYPTGDECRTEDDALAQKTASRQRRPRESRDSEAPGKEYSRGNRERDISAHVYIGKAGSRERRRKYTDDLYVEKSATRSHRRKTTEEAVLLDKHSPKRSRRRDAEFDASLEGDTRNGTQVKRRLVSGALLEEGNGKTLKGLRGGLGGFVSEKLHSDSSSGEKKYSENSTIWARKKNMWIILGTFALLLAILIPVAIVTSKKKGRTSPSSSTASGKPNNSNLAGISESDIPVAARGTYLDPFTWYDTSGFNVTYTNETVGGLPIMGLNTTYDNSVSANSATPPISDSWGDYIDKPARGVNLGGWLSLEPFITPSLFDYSPSLGIIDEWTLTSYLGPHAPLILEKHYDTFITEQDFKDIAAAGLDHVRIQFSYWAVAVYDDDPYIFRTSWRYLLRGIEWARKHGLRVNLDLHGIPGSQNGWNHSGRQGIIRWLNGTDGDLNAQRSLDIHNRLSQFFSQPRYKNLIAFYGLVNEPRMVSLDISAVRNWTESAYKIVRKNGYTGQIVFGDGFLGLGNWQGLMTGYSDLVLDVHQYLIFNVANIPYNHTYKVTYACTVFHSQQVASLDVSSGYGPTMNGEWSLADTDCATWLNDVNVGSRWTGTYNTDDPNTQVLSPVCPTATENTCECADANADMSTYSSAYKTFLQMFAEAQMKSFETGYGWFYWTWKTESAPQWSYQDALRGGFMPKDARKPSFDCTATPPDFAALGLPEKY